MNVDIIALDLEQTLIDDSFHGNPRPGLFEFLEFCQEAFQRVMIFTTVETEDAREVLENLADQGQIPFSFLRTLEFVDWSGPFKDLRLIPNASPNQVFLLDDDAGWIHPDQQKNWIPIAPWQGQPDQELKTTETQLKQMLLRS